MAHAADGVEAIFLKRAGFGRGDDEAGRPVAEADGVGGLVVPPGPEAR